MFERIADQPNVTVPQANAQFIRSFYQIPDCFAVDFKSQMESYSNITWDGASYGRQWVYQLCTGLGWFHSSGSRFQPFGSLFPVDFIYQHCEDLFDINRDAVDEATRKTNEKYGGYNPNVDNVYFTQGEVDPWRVVGLQGTQTITSPVVVIRGASHGQDLNELSPSDNAEMHAAKMKIKELIEQWIKEHKNK